MSSPTVVQPWALSPTPPSVQLLPSMVSNINYVPECSAEAGDGIFTASIIKTQLLVF